MELFGDVLNIQIVEALDVYKSMGNYRKLQEYATLGTVC
jgi:hypothetical protein